MLEVGPGLREGAPFGEDSHHLSRFCCTFAEVNLFQRAFRWGDSEVALAWVSVPPVGHAGAGDPWAGRVAGHQFQFLATLEDALDGQGFHSGSVEAAGLAAIAAVRVRMDQSVPMRQAEGCDEQTGQSGTGDWQALHVRPHCSGGTVQVGIQDPLDSVNQDSDGVGVESVAGQRARCSALLDRLG